MRSKFRDILQYCNVIIEMERGLKGEGMCTFLFSFDGKNQSLWGPHFRSSLYGSWSEFGLGSRSVYEMGPRELALFYAGLLIWPDIDWKHKMDE